jgi:hypothetical protein
MWEISRLITLDFVTPEDNSYKFGYYNYSPLSFDNTKLLAHRFNFEGRPVNADDEVEVGYFDIHSGKWHSLDKTKAFNWQIGSMLQWLGPDFNNKVIFNAVGNGQYISKVLNLDTNTFINLPKAIHACDKEGMYSYTLNYERANFTRAYNYESFVDISWDESLPPMDGIVKLNLITGETETILTVSEIIDFFNLKIDNNTYYWLEHISLNRECSCFSVYLRYGYGDNFITKCVFVDPNGKILGIHRQNDVESISHLGWRSEWEYTIFTRKLTQLQYKLKHSDGVVNHSAGKKIHLNFKYSLLKIYKSYFKHFVPRWLVETLIGHSNLDSYQLGNVFDGILAELKPSPNIDGHPSFTKDGEYLLTDTYADRMGYRNLLLFNVKNKKTFKLGRFFSFYNNCSWRTDLHPRFSYDESRIIIDSNHSGSNQILVFKIDWDLIR